VKVWADYQPWLDQPFEVSIETFSKCNATCTFCPYTQLDRIGTKMPDELIDRLFGEMAEWKNGFGLSLFKVNEPLLDKRVLPLIERANREIPQAHPRLFSNGSTLTDVNVERIAGLKKLTHLWVSLNEYREEEYEKLMGISWKRTTENLDRLHERDFPHPVVLSCVGNPAPEFKAYCEKRWPKFQVFALKKDAWIDFTDPQIKEVPDSPCSRWWELNITATGSVAHCCMDSGDPRWAIGDVNKQTMLEVYNSPFWRERREKFLSRKELDNRSPCNRCTYAWALAVPLFGYLISALTTVSHLC
jgi:radical SAM protein with 4Fe4S-binding SPASM domain